MGFLTTLNERLRSAEQTAEFLRLFLNCMLLDIWQRDKGFHGEIVTVLNEKGWYGELHSDAPLQVQPFVDVDIEGLDLKDFFEKEDD